ncbi:MAG: flippase-like domain-containing protein [Rhodospirillum sp.]|nr:flippase-like domain-containing protein [Rhodospirillum sp.]MCF8488134.1 flippase-like domain-containing protein [Rhodospirillum sp.]MCF8499974.1 flippase-like domain-containing protein [Rhodospirillum sp.]
MTARKVLLALLSLLLVGAAFTVAGVDGVLVRLRSYSLETLVLATGFLAVNQILGSLRFHFMVRLLGIEQSLWRSHVVNVYSLIGGVLLFNFLGQSVARTGMFKMDRKGGAAQGFASTVLERALSLVLLVALLVGLVIQYTDGISTYRGHVNAYLTLSVMVGVVVAVVFRWGLGRHRWAYLARLLNGRVLTALILSTVVTALMLATMLAAYVVLARELLPGVPWTALPLPAVVSMLGASVPIGVAGWGVRELAASQAFSYIGMDPAAGVGMALAVGALSLVALGLNTLVVLLFRRERTLTQVKDSRSGGGRQYLRFLTWALPILCVALLVFRLPVPTQTGFTNINLADPFVLVSTVLLLVGAWGAIGRIWRVPGMWATVAAMVGVVCLSFVLGWIRFGLLDWAFFNRFCGVWVLLSMMLAGAFVTNTLGRAGTVMVARSYVLAVVVVLLFELLLRAVEGGNPFSLLPWNGEAFSGFSGGATAYAYEISLALILVLSGLPLFSNTKAPVFVHGIAGILALGLWRAESPSAMVSMSVILVVFALAKRFSPWRFLLALTIAWGGIEGLTLVREWLGTGAVFRVATSPFSNRLADWPPPVWAGEGYDTVRAALSLWLENPLFGAGLGAYLDGRLNAGLPLMVIRGTYAWALGEMGLIGLILFLSPVFLGVLAMVRLLTKTVGPGSDMMDRRIATACLGMIFVTLVMSVFHDLAYQRDFWLLLGAFLATPGALAWTFRRTAPGPDAQR